MKNESIKYEIIFILERQEKPITGDHLLKLINRRHEISKRSMRKLISEMEQKDGYMIISNLKGYYLARNAKEYQSAIDFYSAYIKSLGRKLKAIKRNYNRLTAKLIPA